jgi:hypothetical protein
MGMGSAEMISPSMGTPLLQETMVRDKAVPRWREGPVQRIDMKGAGMLKI